MAFNINLGRWKSIFAVPSQVVDEDLKIASSYQLKVLLYLLRHSGEDFTYEFIGEQLSIHPDDVKDSVLFWTQRGLIVNDGGELTPAPADAVHSAESIESEKQALPERENENSNAPLKHRPLTRPPRPSLQFVSQRLTENPAVAALMDEAQTALQKPLASGDICTLYMLFDTYGLPPEVILMLIHYAVSIDMANMNFIEKEGIRWSDESIFSIEQAEAKITELKNRYSAWGRAAAVFGIKSAGTPTKAQLAFADCWINEWKFSNEILREAYERCVNHKGLCDLKYINGILKNWHKKGVAAFGDIALKDSPATKKAEPKKTVAANTSYNVDELDQTSIFD